MADKITDIAAMSVAEIDAAVAAIESQRRDLAARRTALKRARARAEQREADQRNRDIGERLSKLDNVSDEELLRVARGLIGDKGATPAPA